MPNLDKIPTIQPLPIRRMDHQRPVSNISRVLGISRQKKIGVFNFVRFIRSHENRAVFATQIADLARLRLFGVARGFLAASIRIKMRARAVAVSLVGDGEFVDMVRCRLSD